MMDSIWESDSVVVSAKPVNNGVSAPAELVEKRTLTKGNLAEQNRHRTQRRNRLQSALGRIRAAGQRDRSAKFTSLMHHISSLDTLTEAFLGLKRGAAAGVDGITWDWYEGNLEGNLQDLSNRLNRGSYRAKPVKRVFIPKPDGQERPLGVPSLEDKIVQRAAVMVLNEVYETDFLGFSYGFRPGRSAHAALDALYTGILTRKVNFILDADIKGFFDALDHSLLLGFLQQRIADPRVLRLVEKWLKAGVMDNGVVSFAERGSPQGGSVSPLLANIFLHFVLDVWVHEWRQREAGASVIVVRYADDFVIGFERKADANRCYRLLQNRFAEHKLELHPEKTRLIEFGPYAQRNAKRLGGRPSTFNFLGFTHIVGRKHSNGMFTVYRRTVSKRKRLKLKEIRLELRKRMHHDKYQVGQWLHKVLSGYYRYYGVPGNYESLSSFFRQVLRDWHRVLNRRSGKTTMSWQRMLNMTNRVLPQPTICHPYPLERMGVTTQGRSRMR